MSERDEIVAALRRQAASCASLGSPFYDALLGRMAEDAARGGPTWRLLGPYADKPPDDAYALRVLGGVHFRVLRRLEPALAAFYPSTGGDGDADAAWPEFVALLDAAPPELVDALRHPPQTNEIGRSASLLVGFLAVARMFGLPLRILELGASAGLNLQFDAYRYEQGSDGFGPPNSSVQFRDLWADVDLPFGVPMTIAERRGCDLDPIDVADPDSRLRLLSYLWPDQTARFERTRAALDLAAPHPPPVDRADAAAWLRERLPGPSSRRITVVFHSIVWPYLAADTAADVRETIGRAGALATTDAPMAWLRLEPDSSWLDAAPSAHAAVRLQVWPGGVDHHLADASFHTGPVRRPGS